MAIKTFANWCKDQLTTNNSPTTSVPVNSAGITNTVVHQNVTVCPSCGTTGSCGCSNTHIYTPTLTSGWQIATTSTIQPLGLSQQEKEELAKLQEEYELETRALRRQEFKVLHRDIRQLIISCLIWQETAHNMKSIGAVKSARMLELEQKNTWSNFNLNNIYNASIDFSMLDLDCGLSKTELIEAHVEACLEEELDETNA